ncbi:hypothetical protein UCRPA7_2630 [Phaeoacremonium minimum UCRPA7]|uniref:Uncharacterized protein n=1 Tax=Phaeoacremonium minimum (strain UCR-PA7) TaxID=1286976 RepID=R8BRC6_PHAM7|nr:hypothetical protein UCRPA7_2630 [Phaeoacremonium minimum UCRPA7]EOO01886.1 hypothetical protein UCRPA7_2630 [Phaeoacremonium minimum UCRPA7]
MLTASFINKDGEQQFFHIYSRDLIILKPLHRFQVWPNMSHIALEFFPGWAHDSYHRYLRNLAGFAANLDFLWFIDHTLTRAPGFEGALPNHTYVFYGKGFRMVEVRRGDDGWVHSDMSPPGSNGPGCFSAIDIMRQEQDRMNAETFEQYSEDPEDVSPYVGARLGVLAFEIVSRDFYE